MSTLKKYFSKLFSKNEESPSPLNKTGEPYVQKFSTEPYDFRTVTTSDLIKEDKALWELYLNEKDGFLIKNFLSEEEVDIIMKNFENVSNEDPAHTVVGFTYPPVFAEFSSRLKDSTETMKQEQKKLYFEKTGNFNRTFASKFGVDVKNRVESLFGSVSGGREIRVAETADGDGKYPFATFRYLVPEKGLMTVHCGNYFGKTFREFYKDLTQTVAVKNQMSYFIMLNEPEEGGELTLFNFRWKDGQTKIDNMEDNEIIQPDGSKMYVESDPNIIKDKIRPKKGDMILFQGGNIWHRVETVHGSRPRITLGGFIGVSIDKTKIYYWS